MSIQELKNKLSWLVVLLTALAGLITGIWLASDYSFPVGVLVVWMASFIIYLKRQI